MVTTRMLIDAAHPEETRVVVLSGNRLEEFDVEVASRKQLKGNIYLAKVVRVEPSLQAAFVDYGGNRHGFLSFNEIHPDYYQIPVADREALLAEQQAKDMAQREAADEPQGMAFQSPDSDPEGHQGSDNEPGTGKEEAAAPPEGASQPSLETVGGDDREEMEMGRRAQPSPRHYRIQEVIKRRQILLVQVVKEERGNKGAALTTYLSLAGRYCVLMPNTARGGGVSRKITSGTDRDRLKKILSDLEIPDGMGVIVRTAGKDKTKTEIKRDCTYLLRLWDSVRELTLQSVAPCLVYEEASLIKRSIRDLYSSAIDEILVQGDEAFRTSKDLMKLLIPSHAKRVQAYTDPTTPLFQRFRVESQIDATHNPVVQLPSGGYIVINPTEALVAIDVNSGRSTRERNIEETALKTNMEAAEEIARQLRLRDLAGLIVIDFIDMEVARNNAKVERQLKDAMRSDRARIQLGKISPFGLLELSRQRLRPSLFETSFEACAYCGGTGIRRSTESSALHVLRAVEEEGIRLRGGEVTVQVPTEIALYILNQQRTALAETEKRYEFSVTVTADDALIPPHYKLDHKKGYAAPQPVAAAPQPREEPAAEEHDAEVETPAEIEAEAPEEAAAPGGEDEGKKRGRRRRRRRRRHEGEHDQGQRPSQGPRPEEMQSREAPAEAQEGEPRLAESPEGHPAPGDEGRDGQVKRRRRGRRGGRRRHRHGEGGGAEATPFAGESHGPHQSEQPQNETYAAEPASSPAPAESAPWTPAPAQVREEQPPEEARRRGNGAGEQDAETRDHTEHSKHRPAPSERAEGVEPREASPPSSKEEVSVSSEASSREPEKPRRGWWERFSR